MKLNLIKLIFLFSFFLSCKKDKPVELPGQIEGPVNCDSISFYSVSAIDGANFQWSVGSDFEILEGQGTWRIKIKPLKSFAQGEICVVVKNKKEETRVCKTIQFDKLLIQDFTLNIPGRKSGIIFGAGNDLFLGMGSNTSFTFFNFSGDQNKIYKLNTSDPANSIALFGLSPQNLKRSSPVYFANGNKFFMGFGTGPNVSFYSDFWVFDQTSQSWSQLASNSSLNAELSSNFVANNKAYICCGRNTSNSNGSNTNWEYDINSNSWALSTPFPGTPRFDASSFSDGNFGYILCGTDNFNVFSDVWKFDANNAAWTPEPNFPGLARSGAIGFRIGSNFYLGGGIGFSGIIYDDFYQLDLNSNSWKNLPNLPFLLNHSAVCTQNNSAYIFGGRSYDFTNGYFLSSKLYEIKF